MKKLFTEEQIIGFLREADAGLTVAELCRRHGFSEASYYLYQLAACQGCHRELATGIQRGKTQEVTGRFTSSDLRRDFEAERR